MGYRYAVIGSGRQGIAAAVDLATHGEAEDVLLLDASPDIAARAAERVNRIAGRTAASSSAVEATSPHDLAALLVGRNAALSALPYHLNPAAARAAIEARCCFNDLGGNTEIVREELSLNDEAISSGVSVVPDCGLAPGMANVLAVCGMERLDQPRGVKIWCGGLPRTPIPPLGYKLVFNVAGLTNEYTGEAVLLRSGRVTRAPTLSEAEEVEFPPPVGLCEAFLTSGGTSTCPWSFEGKLESFEYRTVRYPGHLDRIRTLNDLGFLDQKPVSISGALVTPREVTHALLAARLDFPDEPDLVVLRVRVVGRQADRTIAIVFDLLDHSDPVSGLSAMERCTGFPAAVVTWLQARGEVPAGARPQELAVPAKRFLEEVRRRGLAVKESAEAAR